ncbi:M20 metallopeptidase family protein (plasmid) [Glutamicibacter bergerei]|uniref:Amidohydrolase n=1 Tax=Glutamicibacter ardleyensis TaxID=225894 RepID=A0ABQ2DVS4_9MICC|nr:M20 family metallopeptidase [Glutamicibacter ardleyensis]GGJ74784.1 amidohydrolase [Glutamicibacter ardleyensis]
MSTEESVVSDAAHLAPEIQRLRHELHRQPEVGLDLPLTQQRILEWLEPLGFEVTLGQELSSVTAVLRGGAAEAKAPSVLLRADMDALPVKEKTGASYASQTGNTMHACGHDLHTAMLAGAATLLADRREQLPGDVVLMFQPGEEGFDGAGHMIGEGVLEAAGSTVDAAFGLHVMSALGTSGQFMSRPGAVMSSSAGLFVTVHGQGGHGSAPYLAKDPVYVAAEMVSAMQGMITRRFDVFDPVVISVGVFEAGHARNVIPETARFEATVRSFSHESFAALGQTLPQLLQGIAAAHGVEVEIELRPEYPVTVNHEDETDFARQAVIELFDSTAYAQMANPLAGSEDFSRVLERVPGAFIFLSALSPGVEASEAQFNHSPYAEFSDDVLPRGTALYTHLAISRLAELSSR